MSAPAKQRKRTLLDRMYGSIRIPCFHMTGTGDDSPIGDTKAADRRIEADSELVGVMGVQPVLDVTLIRHTYVRTASRRR